MKKNYIQEALERTGSRFELIKMAAKRAHQLQKNHSQSKIEEAADNKETVVALHEIAKGLINYEKIYEYDRVKRVKRQQEAQIYNKRIFSDESLYGLDEDRPSPDEILKRQMSLMNQDYNPEADKRNLLANEELQKVFASTNTKEDENI